MTARSPGCCRGRTNSLASQSQQHGARVPRAAFKQHSRRMPVHFQRPQSDRQRCRPRSLASRVIHDHSSTLTTLAPGLNAAPRLRSSSSPSMLLLAFDTQASVQMHRLENKTNSNMPCARLYSRDTSRPKICTLSQSAPTWKRLRNENSFEKYTALHPMYAHSPPTDS